MHFADFFFSIFIRAIMPMKNAIWSLKIKMDNPTFVDEETIEMVHQDEDYDYYNAPNTSRVDETSFI